MDERWQAIPLRWRRVLPFAVATAVFLAMTTLYVAGQRGLYDTILKTWGIEPYAFAFLDTDTVMSAVRCLRRGVDVFVVNPCDVLGRVYDYSPLWLLLAKLPVTDAWTMPAGFVVDAAFLLSLLLLPVARGRAECCFILLGLLSPGVVFAVERGNNDLVLFVLAAIAATLACRTPALRLLGYAAALLAGLLKYYPMLLMILATRERPARFWAVTAASVAVLLLFLAVMGHDLVRALRLIPVGPWFGDMFGSSTAAGGLAAMLGWSDPVRHMVQAAMTLAAWAAGLWIGLRRGIAEALARLSDAERMALLAGSALIIACFFTAQNIGYRVTHLLLVLPALTALWRLDRRRVWAWATGAAIALLWSQNWGSLPRELWTSTIQGLGTWLVRETLWWGLVTLLIALTVSLTASSTMGRIVLRRALV